MLLCNVLEGCTVWLSWKLKHNYMVIVRHIPCYHLPLLQLNFVQQNDFSASVKFYPLQFGLASLHNSYALNMAVSVKKILVQRSVRYQREGCLNSPPSAYNSDKLYIKDQKRHKCPFLVLNTYLRDLWRPAKEMSNARPDGLTPWLHSYWPWPATKAHSLVDVKREYFIARSSWCGKGLNR